MELNLLQLLAISGLLSTGMGVALLGSVKVALARKLEIDEARVGGLVSMFPLAMIPVILAMGFLTDLFGQQPVVIGGAIGMAASLVVLAFCGKYWHALVGVLMLSAGWSALINVLNVLMPDAFAGGTEAYSTNFGNFFFGLGAFLTPLLIAFLLTRVGFSPTLCVLGAFTLISGVLALGFDFASLADAAPQVAGAIAPTFATVLQDPIMWILGFALFFYGPLEASVAAWSTTIMGERGVRESTAAWLLSGFWLAFMASRLATALTVGSLELKTGWETPTILALAVLAIAVLAAMVTSKSRNVVIASVVLAGLVFGPIFPTLMGVLLSHFDRAVQGRAVGLFFAIGGIGWTGIPILIGAYAGKTSVQRAFSIAVIAAVGLSVVCLVLHLAIAT